MMKTYCNPLDLGYRYQHMKEGERIAGFREGADPTLVYFKGKYYLFVSIHGHLVCDCLYKDFSVQIRRYPNIKISLSEQAS